MTKTTTTIENSKYGTVTDPDLDQRAPGKIGLSVKSNFVHYIRTGKTSKEACGTLKNAFENLSMSRRLMLKRQSCGINPSNRGDTAI